MAIVQQGLQMRQPKRCFVSEAIHQFFTNIRLHLLLLPTQRKAHEPSFPLHSVSTILIHTYICMHTHTHTQNGKRSCIPTTKHMIWDLLQFPHFLMTRETVKKAENKGGWGELDLFCTASKIITKAETLPLIPNWSIHIVDKDLTRI